MKCTTLCFTPHRCVTKNGVDYYIRRVASLEEQIPFSELFVEALIAHKVPNCFYYEIKNSSCAPKDVMPSLRDKVRGIWGDTSACTGSSVEHTQGSTKILSSRGPSFHTCKPPSYDRVNINLSVKDPGEQEKFTWRLLPDRTEDSEEVTFQLERSTEPRSRRVTTA